MLEADGFSIELDRDGDLQVDALSVRLPFDSVKLSSDGGPFVVFKVTHLELPVSNMPAMGQVMLSDGAEGSVDCSLLSTELSIPVSALCMLDAPSASEQCGGACEAPEPADVHGTVECELKFDLDPSRTYLSVRIAPSTTFTPDNGVQVSVQLDKVVPKSLGQVFIDVHETDIVNLDGVVVEVSVDGAPETISIRTGEASFDVDENNDGIAEDVWETIDGGTVTLTPECTDSLTFEFSHFEMSFRDVPLLGDLVLTEDPENSDLNCTLRGDQVTFDVLNR